MPIGSLIQRFGGRNKVAWGTAPPTSGRWKEGDVVVNTSPNTGLTFAWVCTAGGSPGTWRPLSGFLTLSLYMPLTAIANGDMMTGFTVPFAALIRKASFVVIQPATTAGKAATLSLKIGNNAVTGGVVTLTSTNCGTRGAVVEGTAVTGANQIAPGDTISLTASNVTAFAEGAGVYVLTLSGL